MNNLNLSAYTGKSNGDTLDASTWNGAFGSIEEKVNEVVEKVNGIDSDVSNLKTNANNNNTPSTTPSTTPSSDSHVSMNEKGNLTIETTTSDMINGKGGKINIEPVSDLQIKPGDDIALYSHHREEGKQDEVAIKVLDGDDVPVKLQINAAEMTLTTKDKTGDNSGVFDVNVNKGKNQKGYFKLRAQAIDLRCEEHGGISLQPKGEDSDHNENKIKFEHGGGDGLEFATFNTKKTSIFTDEYRFNKDGVWKMARRTKVASDKYDGEDETTHYKYQKQTDDFYDIIDSDDETATTNSIIKTAQAFNDGKNRHAKYKETTKNNVTTKTLEVETVVTVVYVLLDEVPSKYVNVGVDWPAEISDVTKIYTISDFKDAVKTLTIDGNPQKYGDAEDEDATIYNLDNVKIGNNYYQITEQSSPSIEISSDDTLTIKGKECTKIGGKVQFASDLIDLGEMETGLQFQYKLTKKNNIKSCTNIQVLAINNHATNDLVFGAYTLHPGDAPQIVTQVDILDVIKLTRYFKSNHLGPWEETSTTEPNSESEPGGE